MKDNKDIIKQLIDLKDVLCEDINDMIFSDMAYRLNEKEVDKLNAIRRTISFITDTICALDSLDRGAYNEI